MSWFDAHNHLHEHCLAERGEIIAELRLAGVARCVVNSTCEADWTEVAILTESHPGIVVPAFGIHPWQAQTAGVEWRQSLEKCLHQCSSATVGEIGLDGFGKGPPMDIQAALFVSQLEVAREFNRVASVHCCKAWEPLFHSLKRIPKLPVMVMHSFSGSLPIAQQLIRMGCYFSISGHSLHPRKVGILDVFRKLPSERILIESDAPNMLPPTSLVTYPLPHSLNHPGNLPLVGRALAHALGFAPAEFEALTWDNALRCFGC